MTDNNESGLEKKVYLLGWVAIGAIIAGGLWLLLIGLSYAFGGNVNWTWMPVWLASGGIALFVLAFYYLAYKQKIEDWIMKK